MKPSLTFAPARRAALLASLALALPACQADPQRLARLEATQQQQARELARGLLAGQLHQLLHAHGSTVGLPRLRAGRAFTLKGFGKRLSGLYLATGTTHRFTAAEGYHTSFCARRLKEDGS